MLGNDVVDLRDADAKPKSFRARFDERVFSADERRAIALDAQPLARRWAHWAAKEAAYKLAKQADPVFVFSPARLIAQFEPATLSSGHTFERRGRLELPDAVGHAIRLIDLRSVETPESVHVIALPMGSDWSVVASGVEALGSEPADPSVAVREMAIQELGQSLGIAPPRLTIGSRGRIPIALLDGSPISLSLSLSHHGRWISFAMAPRTDSLGHTIWRDGSIDSIGRGPRADSVQ